MAKKTKKISKKVAKKAAKKAASALTDHRLGGGKGTASADDSRALPDPRVRAEDVDVLRSAIEGLSALLNRRLDDQQRTLEQLQQAAAVSAPAQPSPYEDNAMGRLLATTSEIRERGARNEVAITAILSRVTLLEENQRPPEPAPDREAAALKASCRWTLANHCRASNRTHPTAAIVGRVMHDERVFDPGAAKSPQEIFVGILTNVRRVFGLATPQPNQEAEAPGQDYVHLSEDIAAIIEGRSSRPPGKHSDYLNTQLDYRLKLLVDSGLATKEPIPRGSSPHYRRYLTPMGREVFSGWPDWADTTGGISLADEPMPPIHMPRAV